MGTLSHNDVAATPARATATIQQKGLLVAILPRFTVAEYNNVARMDDIEHATWLLTKLEQDVKAFQKHLNDIQRRYPAEGIPQDLCDQIGQLGEDLFDHLRRIDPAQQREYDQWAEEQQVHDLVALHDRYEMHLWFGAESIKGGHC